MSTSMKVCTIPCYIGIETKPMEESMEIMDSSEEVFQRLQCVVVLKYFWLKEEMTKATAMSIASGLFAAQHNRNGLMSAAHYERLSECRRRRQKVDLLLQHIIHGTRETHIMFRHLLKQAGDEHIAKSLEELVPTDKELQEFKELQLSSRGMCARPNSNDPRFIIQDGEFQMLSCALNDITTIETIGDFFLSRLFFSIREHKNISLIPLKDEQRISSLLDTMRKCSFSIRTAFKEVLRWLKMDHVFSNIYDTEAVQSDKDKWKDNSVPLLRLDRRAEKSIVVAVQTEPMDLCTKALKEVSYDVEEVDVGSIVIRLRPTSKDCWKKFQEKCSSGDIKNFIASVYQNQKIFCLLAEGRYEIDVKIYKEIPNTKRCSPADEDGRVIIRLKDRHETDMDGGFIDRHMDLLCEEMEISNNLLSYLKQKEIIDEFIETELEQKSGRANKVHHLLSKLSMKGSYAADLLKTFIQRTDKELFEEIESEETELVKKMVSAEIQIPELLYFTAIAILQVRKTGSGSCETDEKKISDKWNWDLWCTTLIDPVFHFENDTNKSAPNTEEKVPLVWTTEETISLEDQEISPDRITPEKYEVVAMETTREKTTDVEKNDVSFEVITPEEIVVEASPLPEEGKVAPVATVEEIPMATTTEVAEVIPKIIQPDEVSVIKLETELSLPTEELKDVAKAPEEELQKLEYRYTDFQQLALNLQNKNRQSLQELAAKEEETGVIKLELSELQERYQIKCNTLNGLQKENRRLRTDLYREITARLTLERQLELKEQIINSLKPQLEAKKLLLTETNSPYRAMPSLSRSLDLDEEENVTYTPSRSASMAKSDLIDQIKMPSLISSLDSDEEENVTYTPLRSASMAKRDLIDQTKTGRSGFKFDTAEDSKWSKEIISAKSSNAVNEAAATLVSSAQQTQTKTALEDGGDQQTQSRNTKSQNITLDDSDVLKAKQRLVGSSRNPYKKSTRYCSVA